MLGIINGVRRKDIVETRKQIVLKAIERGYKNKEIANFLNCAESYITKIRNKIELEK